jgi:hypothetical protein
MSVSAFHNALGDDVVYATGTESTTNLIRRVEVKRGVHVAQGCKGGHVHMVVSSKNAAGKCVVPVQRSAEMTGAVAIAAVSEAHAFVTSSSHYLVHADLSLEVGCQPWITNAMNHWDSDPDKTGQIKEANRFQLTLFPTSGFGNLWTFRGLRKVTPLSEYKFGEGNVVTNVMCFKEDDVPASGVWGQEMCCVTKAGPNLRQPLLCDYLTSMGMTSVCPSEHSALYDQAMAMKALASCSDDVCVKAGYTPESGDWIAAEGRLRRDLADWNAEELDLKEKLKGL